MNLGTLGIGACLLLAAQSAMAVPYAEVGDASDLPPSQAVGVNTTSITGAGGTGDVDMYSFTWSGGALTIDTFAPFGFDTQLFLFDSAGFGVRGNDDHGGACPGVPGSGLQSCLDLSGGLAAGTYYLAISAFNNDPLDGAAVAMMSCPGFTTQCTSVGGPLAGWSGPSTTPGGSAYQINFSEAVSGSALEVAKSYRHTNVCFERDNDSDGLLSEDPLDMLDNDDDGLIDEDASECPDGTSPGDEIANDGEGTYSVESVVKKNGSVTSYNPGQLYALVTANVLADIDELHFEELYSDCTDDPPDLLDLNPQNGGGRAVVVLEHPDGTLEQVFDANTDDANVVFESDETATSVSWLESFAAGDIVHLFVKFGPGRNSTGEGSCVNEAVVATPVAGGEFFEEFDTATLVVTPKQDD